MGPGRPCIWETVAASRVAPMHPAGFYNILRSGDVTGHRIEKPTHHTSSQRSSKRERVELIVYDFLGNLQIVPLSGGRHCDWYFCDENQNENVDNNNNDDDKSNANDDGDWET